MIWSQSEESSRHGERRSAGHEGVSARHVT